MSESYPDVVQGGVVFRGNRASAEVVASFLRTTGIHLVEVIPPTPYPAGPLGQALVRVEEDEDKIGVLLASQRLTRRLTPRPFPLGARLVAATLILERVLLGSPL